MAVDQEAKMEATRVGHNLHRPSDLGLPAPPKDLATFKLVPQAGNQAFRCGPMAGGGGEGGLQI